MPESITVLTVADREADIYDFLATQRPENSQLLIRAYHNRQVKNSDGTLKVERLQNASAKIQVAGQLSLELQTNPKRSGRQEILNLRATTVEILPPQSHPQHLNLQPLLQASNSGLSSKPASHREACELVVINHLADYWF